MSKETALAFAKKTSSDPALQSRVAALGPGDAAGLVGIAASAGYAFSAGDLKDFLAEANARGELGDAELESVSGGLNPQPLPPRVANNLFRLNPALFRGIILVSGH